MTLRRTALQLLLATLLVGSCRFQDLTPGSARHDDVMVQGLVSTFYQTLAARDLPGLQRLSLPAATVLMAPSRGPAVLVPIRTLIDVPERRNQRGGAHIVRTELHADGDVASDRVVVTAQSTDGRREFEASDVLTLAHRAGAWQVAHVMFGPWRSRSAP